MVSPTGELLAQVDLQGLGSATVTTPDGSGKEPDSSFLPRTLPEGRSDVWLSVIMLTDVGASEISAQMQSDVAWWIEKSGGDVRAVVAMHVWKSPGRPGILIEERQKLSRVSRLPGRAGIIPRLRFRLLRSRLTRYFSDGLLHLGNVTLLSRSKIWRTWWRACGSLRGCHNDRTALKVGESLGGLNLRKLSASTPPLSNLSARG